MRWLLAAVLVMGCGGGDDSSGNHGWPDACQVVASDSGCTGFVWQKLLCDRGTVPTNHDGTGSQCRISGGGGALQAFCCHVTQ